MLYRGCDEERVSTECNACETKRAQSLWCDRRLNTTPSSATPTLLPSKARHESLRPTLFISSSTLSGTSEQRDLGLVDSEKIETEQKTTIQTTIQSTTDRSISFDREGKTYSQKYCVRPFPIPEKYEPSSTIPIIGVHNILLYCAGGLVSKIKGQFPHYPIQDSELKQGFSTAAAQHHFEQHVAFAPDTLLQRPFKIYLGVDPSSNTPSFFVIEYLSVR